jgi:hypothetical protein
VLAQIEAGDLMLLLDVKTDHDIHKLEQDQRADEGEDPGGQDGDDLKKKVPDSYWEPSA